MIIKIMVEYVVHNRILPRWKYWKNIQRTSIPIEHKKEKTNNYYLQFKHQYDRHTKDKTPHLQLRMVTDGTLLQEVITNPIMKEEDPLTKS